MFTGLTETLGTVQHLEAQGVGRRLIVAAPTIAAELAIGETVAVDGISLTLVDVALDRFSVALIPHTLACTTLGFKPVGATVNLETDLLAKYVGKYLQHLRP